MASIPHAAATTGIDSSPRSAGYRLNGADRGVCALGDDPFHGSMGGLALDAPVIGITRYPATGGCWEVGTDGGVFAFDAAFCGAA